jgi:hypothetical protein
MKLIFLILLCILYGNIKCQNSNYSFFNYFKDHFNPNDSSECGESNELLRMYRLWGARLGTHGNVNTLANGIVSYTNDFLTSQKYKSLLPSTDWNCLGPTGSNGNSNDNSEIGRMNRICFDPQYDGQSNNTIYSASEFGGLWITVDDGYNWVNVNTDLQLPTTSIGDICVSFQNSDHLFLATGMGDYGISYWTGNKTNCNPVFTWGIYRSINYGLTSVTVNDVQVENNTTGWISTNESGGTGGLARFTGQTCVVYDTSNSPVPGTVLKYLLINIITNG